MMRSTVKVMFFSLALCITTCPLYAQQVSTPISYQGTLDILDEPANGSFDFRVALFDSIELGSQIPGSAAPVFENIFVEEGLVNLSIDFGAGVFNGEPRFIQIEVRDAMSSGNYTILQPRQAVFTAPYSISTSKVEGDIFQRGTIGTCQAPGSAGLAGDVVFPKAFSSAPQVFLTGDESFNSHGCVSVRLDARSNTGFSWTSWDTIDEGSCDCIHWLAIGPPLISPP